MFICSFHESNNVVQIAITKAICASGNLLPVEKTFSRIHDNVELSLSSLFIGAKSFS